MTVSSLKDIMRSFFLFKILMWRPFKLRVLSLIWPYYHYVQITRTMHYKQYLIRSVNGMDCNTDISIEWL